MEREGKTKPEVAAAEGGREREGVSVCVFKFQIPDPQLIQLGCCQWNHVTLHQGYQAVTRGQLQAQNNMNIYGY